MSINPELEKYIDTSLKTNMDPASIRRILVAAGWNADEVDAAIEAQTKSHASAIEFVPPTAVTPASTTANPATGPATSPEITSAEINARQKKGLPKKALIVGAAALVLVIIAGGLTYAFYSGLLARGNNTSDNEFLAKLPDTLQAIKSATYEGSLDFTSEPRIANAIPLVLSDYYPPSSTSSATVSFLQNLNSSYAQIPADISIHVTAGGSTLNANTSTTDGTFHGGAEIKLADFNLSADADFLKKDSNFYFRVNKFPSLFIDISALKGKWVVITPEDLGGSVGMFGVFDPSDVEQLVSQSRDANKKSLEQARLIYRLAAENGLIVLSSPVTSEKINGIDTRHFQLALAKDNIPSFYAQVTKALHDQYGDEALLKFDQATANYLTSPQFSKFYDYLKANGSLEIWLDAKTGQLVKYTYSLRIVPPPEVQKLKDVEFMLRLTLSLKDINQPLTVTAPTDAMTFEDAEVLISGKSKEEVEAERQVSNIMSLQYALGTYHDYAGKYPDSLDALLISYADLYHMNQHPSVTPVNDSFTQAKLLQKIPVDAYTKKPYSYHKLGTDYSIEYIVNIPTGSNDYQLLSVVNGVNHATSQAVSIENKPPKF